jgi:hypothetical protein
MYIGLFLKMQILLNFEIKHYFFFSCLFDLPLSVYRTCLERILCSTDTQVNLRRILLATKLSNDLPGEKRADYDYYSTFAGFRAVMQSQVRSSVKKLEYVLLKACVLVFYCGSWSVLGFFVDANWNTS